MVHESPRTFIYSIVKTLNAYLVPEFSQWSNWSGCSAECDGGIRTRSRSCTDSCHNIEDNNAQHHKSQTEQCNQHLCGEYLANSKQKRLPMLFSSTILELD